MKKRSAFILYCLSSPLQAHHGQDFLVTIDTGQNDVGAFRSTFGGEYTRYGDDNERSLTQSLILGLPHRMTLLSIFRYADDGQGSRSSFSASPMLQWTLPRLDLDGPFSSLQLAIAGGWEIPINRGDRQDHSHSPAPLADCSGLVGIPTLFQACQMVNQNAANHSHGDEGHLHGGIHRHGESHGFLRFVAEIRPTPKDRFVVNTITVFPEGHSPQWGYAAAYRHRFTEQFAFGIETIGDFDVSGEHLVYLTGTSYINNHLSLTIGGATGLTSNSPDLTLQTLVSWRF